MLPIENAPYDSILAARYLQALSAKQGYAPNATQLQKLLYIAYGTYLAETGQQLVKEHFKAVIALPFAAICALLLVFASHKLNESSKVQFWGIKFEGAASLVISWILTFVTLAVAIAYLW